MGKITDSENHLPHCQQLQRGFFCVVVGYSDRGIRPGTVMGKKLAEWFEGKAKRLVRANNHAA